MDAPCFLTFRTGTGECIAIPVDQIYYIMMRREGEEKIIKIILIQKGWMELRYGKNKTDQALQQFMKIMECRTAWITKIKLAERIPEFFPIDGYEAN